MSTAGCVIDTPLECEVVCEVVALELTAVDIVRAGEERCVVVMGCEDTGEICDRVVNEDGVRVTGLTFCSGRGPEYPPKNSLKSGTYSWYVAGTCARDAVSSSTSRKTNLC